MQSYLNKIFFLKIDNIKLKSTKNNNKYTKNVVSEILYNNITNRSDVKITKLKIDFINLIKFKDYIKYLYKSLFLINYYN